MTQQQIDPFATTESRPSVSFKNAPVGTSFQLEVTKTPQLVQSRNFDTRELDFWPDGNPKMTVVTEVVDRATGEEKSLWAPKPSSMFAGIQAAQQAAGAQIAVGGVLVVTFTHEVPVEGKPHLNPAKQYAVSYAPPNAFAEAPAFVQQAMAPQQGVVPAQQVVPGQPVAPLPPQAYPAGAQPIPAAQPVQQAPVQSAPAQVGPTPEQVAAVRAAGQDPAVIWPGFTG